MGDFMDVSGVSDEPQSSKTMENVETEEMCECKATRHAVRNGRSDGCVQMTAIEKQTFMTCEEKLLCAEVCSLHASTNVASWRREI
jgi:hypothetical protein